jgi:Cytochrome c554 and c-prime
MNTRVTLPTVLVLVTLGFSYGLLRGGVVPQGPTLPIFSTGDQAGEVASCGCPREDYGGTTRKAAFFDTLRASSWEFVLVEAGDLTPFQELDAQGRLKVETLARSMATQGYQGILLGDHDLAPGPDYVRRLVDWLGQPVLATNYTLPEGVPAERSRIVTARGHRIGLLGFLDPGLAQHAAPWVKVDSWESARSEVKALRKQVDLLVAMAHAPDTTSVKRLAKLYPEIDLVIGAHEGKTAQELTKVGQSYIIGSMAKGRFVTRVEVAFKPTGRLDNMRAAFLPVVETWGRRATVDSLLADYYRQVRELTLSSDYLAQRQASLLEPPVEFVGNEACVACHAAQSTQWKTTFHSHAHETLVKDDKDHDPECQTCHTTGFGFKTGFVAPSVTPDRWEVGCESCHGGGAAHVKEPKTPGYGTVSEATCRGCHTADRSPDFNYSTYLPKVTH